MISIITSILMSIFSLLGRTNSIFDNQFTYNCIVVITIAAAFYFGSGRFFYADRPSGMSLTIFAISLLLMMNSFISILNLIGMGIILILWWMHRPSRKDDKKEKIPLRKKIGLWLLAKPEEED